MTLPSTAAAVAVGDVPKGQQRQLDDQLVCTIHVAVVAEDNHLCLIGAAAASAAVALKVDGSRSEFKTILLFH